MSALNARFDGRFGGFELAVALETPLPGVTALFGPSGSGKTTLLKCLAGLIRTRHGQLSVDGEVWQSETIWLPPHRRAVGYVPQGADLFPHLTVADNLRFGLRRRGRAVQAVGFDDVTAMLRLDPLLKRTPSKLSGGERQRVAIGRALLASPRLLLLDEPLSGLDSESRAAILDHLDVLRRRLALPTLLVSHDLSDVVRLADRMVRMTGGRIDGVDSVEESLSRLDLPLARASDASVLLRASVRGYTAVDGLLSLDVGGTAFLMPQANSPVEGQFRLRVFASDVALSRTPAAESTILNRVPCRILDAVPAEPFQMIARLGLGDGADAPVLLARVTRRSWTALNLAAGDRVWALVKAASIAGG